MMTETVATTTLTGQVARLYFDRQLTKVEIATRLGISRFRVARLIDQALADGVVRIEFRDAPDQDLPLARALEERFGLDLGIVAAGGGSLAISCRCPPGRDLIDGLLGTGEAIGIAWGTTVARVVEAIPQQERPVDRRRPAGRQLDEPRRGSDPGDLTRVLAARLGGRSHRIHAPAFLESAELRAALVRQPDVAATVAHFDDLAIALVGIGALGSSAAAPSSSLLRSGALSPADAARLARLGAVGDLLVHPFDAAGRFVAPEIAGRAVAIDVEQLRRVPGSLRSRPARRRSRRSGGRWRRA